MTEKSSSNAANRAAQARGRSQKHGIQYDFSSIERKWQGIWEERKLYQVDLQKASKPYYNLMMFPYPSAEGLHVGNVYAYVGSDIHGRWQAMQGYDVFEPMGFDAFGIHSENFAIKKGIHPRVLTAQNVRRFRDEQLKRIGNRFDWSHELNTTDPHYYHWTQWIFVQLFKGGLAERRAAPVNWCPFDKTVLADEQVINGRCERCGNIVEKRWLEQWFLKITRYAQKLLDDLDHMDWSERVKALQRNWIGRSEGLEFAMAVVDRPDQQIQVYTTRPDTIFGVTFVALAPHHPLIDSITQPAYRDAVEAYQQQAERLTEADERAMTGVFTGAYAQHPFTGERIPIYVADFVLSGYGAGAVMGVPAHDERDWEFAHALSLPIRVAVQPGEGNANIQQGAFVQPGILVNSGEFSGMTSVEASQAIIAEVERRKLGQRSIKYRLRDWLISRQRYWGPPIPIIYCPEHGAVPVPEDQLPVLLPDVEEWKPTGTGSSPLAAIESFVQTTCPICGKPARRETDVNDNFLDSAWYFLRYPSSNDDTQPWNPALTRKWLPIDMYIGGPEHSVLHLMYARFITMALYDLGYLHFDEPFKRFRAHGLITKDGAKISKSRGNVINPDDYIAQFGADVFRIYLMFMGPYEIGGDFSDRGIGGVVRFLDRVWQLVTSHTRNAAKQAPQGEAKRTQHQTIKRVTEEIAALKYNTTIAALMEYLNTLEARREQVTRAELQTLLLLLAPFAPFLTEELWERMGNTFSIHKASWPSYDPAILHTESITLIVQVNGRVRDRIEVSHEATEAAIQNEVLASEKVKRFIGEQHIQRVVYVPGRLVNVVTTQPLLNKPDTNFSV
ncbi:leucine--tRNA ligase [Reticulibacter mediterranei]|uniref:Leucine--tRNA ligase n=1 Tax=Reticulibacter mediterranei TaxID=2778369 RepID=A0A8J3N3G0_9CHLR|nr:leucine--tRNA ligase [Reticulibacter mediterranei]GHO94328.1 leucine--tRNA ligase [Reticulibacter mediterranei]